MNDSKLSDLESEEIPIELNDKIKIYIDLLNKHGLTVEKFNELRVDFNKLYRGDKNETD